MTSRLTGVIKVEQKGEGTPITVNKSTSGDGTIITCPTGKRLKIKGLSANNASDTDTTVKFQFEDDGTDYFFRNKLPSGGGTWNWNLINSVWIGNTDQDFMGNQDQAKEINYNIVYEVI